MEKIQFTDPDTNEVVEFAVEEQPQRRKQTRQQGKKKKAERLKRKPEQRRKQKVRLQRL